MSIFIDKVLEKCGESPTILTKRKITKIKNLFPIPVEQTILWADVKNGHRISGIVLTDKGVFIKGSSKTIKDINSNIKERKNRIKTIYHYIKWENFSLDDFETKADNDKVQIFLNGNLVLTGETNNRFFEVYKDTYDELISNSAISTSNLISNYEAITPENFAAVNTKTGHGEMAEEALNLIDKFKGKYAEVRGRSNELNGEDRYVKELTPWGIKESFIQTKYHSSAQRSINSCFDKTTGNFRYYKNDEPMKIEVPKDQYEDALMEFKKKIQDGKVPGVTNPNDASKNKKKGKITYNQARNLCKAGTKDSLVYDVRTGAIHCGCIAGITVLTSWYLYYRSTGDKKAALKNAWCDGMEVFGTSFLSHIAVQQLVRTDLIKQLTPLSQNITNTIGQKNINNIANANRMAAGKKKKIRGATARKHFEKLVRTNIFISFIRILLFLIPNTWRLFKKKISLAEYFKSFIVFLGTMIFSFVGALLGGSIGGLLGGILGGISGVLGSIIGGLLVGMIAGNALKRLLNVIREDDDIILSRLFNSVFENMVNEYQLNEKEIENVLKKIQKIRPRKMRKLLYNTHASKQQELVMEGFLRTYFEKTIKKRPIIKEPNIKELMES